MGRDFEDAHAAPRGEQFQDRLIDFIFIGDEQDILNKYLAKYIVRTEIIAAGIPQMFDGQVGILRLEMENR